MAQSLSSTLRSSGLRTGSVLYNVLSKRWYGLAKRATGEHSWAKNRLAKKNERGDELPPSIDELMETPMASLKSCRNAKVTKLNEVYDLCLTPDDIAKAEKFLIAYRHGLSFPRDSLPLVVVRACVRAGLPERALHYVRNKVQFGVFPTRKVYKILMNSLLEKGAAKGVMAAYDLLLSDEWTPDGMTYNIAARATLQLELDRIGLEATNPNSSADTTQNETGGDSDVAKNESEGGVEAVKNESEGDVEAAKNESEGDVEAPKSESDVAQGLDLTKTLELCNKCSELEPRLGTKTYRVIVTRLLTEGYTDEASELLGALEADNKLPKQTLFNLKLDLYTSASDFTGALALLDTLRSNRELGMPKEGLPRLREAITETRNSELLNSLDSMCADLEQ